MVTFSLERRRDQELRVSLSFSRSERRLRKLSLLSSALRSRKSCEGRDT